MKNTDSNHIHKYDAKGRQICCTQEEKINHLADKNIKVKTKKDSCCADEKPVKAGRKNKNDTDRQKIAQPYGHGTWLHFLLAPRRGRTTGGSSFTPDICGGLGCHEQRKRKGGMNRPSVLLSTC